MLPIPTPHPLIDTAPSYNYPISSGLLGAMSGLGQAPPGSTNFSAQAMQMAGNPRAGQLASVPTPSLIPGSVPGSGGGSNFGAVAGGLLSALARNPSLVKSGVNGIMSLMGGGGSAVPALTGADIAAGTGGGVSDAAVTAGLQNYADAGIANLGDVGAGASDAAAGSAAADTGAGAASGGLGSAALAAAPFAAFALPIALGMSASIPKNGPGYSLGNFYSPSVINQVGQYAQAHPNSRATLSFLQSLPSGGRTGQQVPRV